MDFKKKTVNGTMEAPEYSLNLIMFELYFLSILWGAKGWLKVMDGKMLENCQQKDSVNIEYFRRDNFTEKC